MYIHNSDNEERDNEERGREKRGREKRGREEREREGGRVIRCEIIGKKLKI